MRWVIQNNLIKEGVKELIYACEQLGVEYKEVSVIPFDSTLPDVDVSKPTIFYGGTNWIYGIWKSGKWSPGAYFNEENFKYTSYLKHWDMLNANCEVTTFKGFSGRDLTDEYFIRPNLDLKQFAGDVIRYSEFSEWYDNLSAGGFLFDTDTEIIVSSPKNIACEWRLFIVNGVVVTGSRYRSWGRLDVVEEVPALVKEFAEREAAKWAPSKVFVLDIGIEDPCRGEFKIIEANCFNSCGFYKSDVMKIVKVIEDESRD